MPLDPSIILQAGRGVTPLKSPDEIADEQANRQMRQMQLMQAQRSMADDQALRDAYAKGGDVSANLQQRGLFKPAMEYQKYQQEQQKFQLERGKATLDALKQAAGAIAANPTEQNAASIIDSVGSLRGIDSSIIDKAKAALYPLRNDPVKIKQLAMAWGADMDAALGKIQNINLGGSEQTQRVNPLTGQIEVLANQQKTVSPDAQLSSSTSIANNQRSNAVAMRGQDMTDARAREFNQLKREGQTGTTSTTLRKEFEGLPEVKNYKQALPSYNVIQEASKRNTPQSDINIVYAVAKLYDPDSVVREGEYATIANSQSIPERVKSAAQMLQGQGRLTPETKAQLIQEANTRMGFYEQSLMNARSQYEDVARRSGGDPTLVVPNNFKPAVSAQSPAPAKGSFEEGKAKDAAAMRAELIRRGLIKP
ncbi:hypothetical protein [Pseudacidovorax intermedius]|uniref:hypothetical protein n=1 Tax=Pseudacidovorax intermedius TaxID=433924 RepID=UPI0005C29D9C|nr:hypothetical protein [Pseudacidovorax intermedius]